MTQQTDSDYPKRSKVTLLELDHPWQGKNGTMYDYKIGFANGEMGFYTSSKGPEEQKPFELSKEVLYELHPTRPKDNKGNLKFVPVKENKFKSKYNDPVTNSKTAMSVCQSVAQRIFTAASHAMPEIKANDFGKVQLVATKLHSWIETAKNDRDEFSWRWNALERAAVYATDEKQIVQYTSVNELLQATIEHAEYFMKYVDDISQVDESNQEPNKLKLNG